jgi:hypothetical protein
MMAPLRVSVSHLDKHSLKYLWSLAHYSVGLIPFSFDL